MSPAMEGIVTAGMTTIAIALWFVVYELQSLRHLLTRRSP